MLSIPFDTMYNEGSNRVVSVGVERCENIFISKKDKEENYLNEKELSWQKKGFNWMAGRLKQAEGESAG